MYLRTGFENLDNLIGGINKKEFITIAGYLGMGKSTLIKDIINNVSKQTKDKVLYFNLETYNNKLEENIKGDNIEIINGNITIEKIKDKCEEASKKGLALAIIDTTQLVSSSLNHDDSNIISYVSRILKVMTLELNIPIIGITQLDEPFDKRENKRPILADFRKFSSTIQDSDKIIFLYRENYYNKEYELNDAELIVVKNRYGPTGKVNLIFNSDTEVYKERIDLEN